MRTKAHAALADGSAFIFIDSINPAGTLNRVVYERMGRIFSESRRYEPYLGGEQAQDVAVYLSTESKFDSADNGKPVNDPAPVQQDAAHRRGGERLQVAHRPPHPVRRDHAAQPGRAVAPSPVSCSPTC